MLKKLAYLVTTDCHSESSAQEAEEKADQFLKIISIILMKLTLK